MAEEMIQVEQVSMRFRMANDRIVSLKEYAIALLERRLKYRDFWVFQDLSFQVRKGEVIGIIGRNGAGKSTLLKVIAGVLTPTKGHVTLHGRVVPMLELGSGFDVELSGRENIFLNGSILGYRKEFLEEKYQEILAFSELEEFIEMPIRNYSSGMLMRLAFSIATIVKPEILIVDEILAVGDEAFQKKSKRKMLELMSGGTTVLFVSHSIEQIREMCQRVIWLEQGHIHMIGESKKVCDAYQEFMNPKVSLEEQLQESRKKNDAENYYMDILLIYGELGEDYEWRVHNQKEQLLAGNMPAAEIAYSDFTEQLIANYRVFFFIGCPDTEQLRRIIKTIKRYHKTVLFDCREIEEWQGKAVFLELKEEIDGIVAATEEVVEEARKEGFFVYWNPDVCSDRIEQLSEWAVYDRDVLPNLDVEQMAGEMEVVNYYRAVKKKKERENGVWRIGCLKKKIRTVKELLDVVFSLEPKVEVFLHPDLKEENCLSKYKGKIRYTESMEREKFPELYAELDLILEVIETEKEERQVYQQRMYAGLVKVPFFVWNKRRESRKSDNDVIEVETAKEFCLQVWKEYQEKEQRKEKIQKSFYQIKEQGTTIRTGWKFAEWIRKQEKPQVTFLLQGEIKKEEQRKILIFAQQCWERGIDTLLLLDRERIFFNKNTSLLCISKTEIYLYGSFDKVIASTWEDCEFLQAYPSIKKRVFLQQGERMEEYPSGDYRRFQMMQAYAPYREVFFCVQNEFFKYYKEQLSKEQIVIKILSSKIENWYQEIFEEDEIR